MKNFVVTLTQNILANNEHEAKNILIANIQEDDWDGEQLEAEEIDDLG